jgi:hypothetical protein
VVKNAVCDVMVVQIDTQDNQTTNQGHQTSGRDGPN